MSHHYIEFKNVCYSYPSGHQALKDVSFKIRHGEKVGLIGRNGAGKSTLLLQTNGLLMPTSGTVDVGGIVVRKKTLPLIRQSVGMVFQNPEDQLFMPTVGEDVAFGPLNMNLPLEDVEKRVDMALEAVGCKKLKNTSTNQLSGGEKRRVAIATVLSMTPSILVLDEPTSNLDWVAREKLVELVESFDHTCLITSHDLGLVKSVCSRVLIMDDGRIIHDISTARLFEDAAILQHLGVDAKTMSLLYTG